MAASGEMDARIAAIGGWRGVTLAHVRALIRAAADQAAQRKGT